VTPSLPFLSDLPLGPGAPFPASLVPAPASAPVTGMADFAELLGSALSPDPDKSAAGAEAAAAPAMSLPAVPVHLALAEPSGGTILPGDGAPLPDAPTTPFAAHTPVTVPAAGSGGAAGAAPRPLAVATSAAFPAGPWDEGALPPVAMQPTLVAPPEPSLTAAMPTAPDVSVPPLPLTVSQTPPAPVDPEAGTAVPAAATRRLAGKTGEVATALPEEPGPPSPRDPAAESDRDGSAPSAPEPAALPGESAVLFAAGLLPAAGLAQPAMASAGGADLTAMPLALAAVKDTSGTVTRAATAALPRPSRAAASPVGSGKPEGQAAAETSVPALAPVAFAPEEAPAAASAAAPAGPASAEAAAPTTASAPALPPVPAPAPIPVALAPERVEAPGQPELRTEPQIESAIAQVGTLREALRAARPEMTLRHAEFGFVSVRLEAAATPDTWRAVLASRDPGFVPAIQAALAERAVAALSAAPDSGGGSGGLAAGQNGTGDQRYGASPNGGQGGSQPYLGHSGHRDGEAAPDHRRPSTAAALAARGEEEAPGSPAPRAGGLFA
jgi:hypothetical protein